MYTTLYCLLHLWLDAKLHFVVSVPVQWQTSWICPITSNFNMFSRVLEGWMDYLLCIEGQTVCQLPLKLLISLTQTHNHRTMCDCVRRLAGRSGLCFIHVNLNALNQQRPETVKPEDNGCKTGQNGRTRVAEAHQAENISKRKPSRVCDNTAQQGQKGHADWLLEPVCCSDHKVHQSFHHRLCHCLFPEKEWSDWLFS